MKKYLSQLHNQQGFVILFTILITAIIFSMGLGIYSIAIRQTILSGTAREAGQAFYSADAGIECALLAEVQGQLSGGTVICNNTSITIDPLDPVFMVSIGDNPARDLCASVNIITNPSARRVISRGFNVCDNGQIPASNPRLVERDLDVTYGI